MHAFYDIPIIDAFVALSGEKSAMPKEIITLQLGNYSNYVGTHWWNIQESSFVYGEEEASSSEIDHDVLFREGQNLRGDVTFTPRLVFCEFNDNMGSLSEEGTLYRTKNYANSEKALLSWDNKVEIHHKSTKDRNEFLQDLYEEDKAYEGGFPIGNQSPVNGYEFATTSGQLSAKTQKDFAKISLNSHTKERVKIYYLDQQVTTWSDYKKVHYHPRSTLLLNQRLHTTDTFESWIAGVNIAKSSDVLGRLEDAVRFYAEECDSMQGFHLLCDVNNGFGGLASAALEYLYDEYIGKSFAVFPTFHAQALSNLQKTKDNTLSTLLTLSNLLPHSSFVCPLSLNEDLFQLMQPRDFPHLIYDASSRYHTSAILAACLDGATCSHRLKFNSIPLAHTCQSLTSGSRKFVGLSGALPLPFDVDAHSNLFDFLMEYKSKELWTAVTPNMGKGASIKLEMFPEHCFSQAVSLVGLEKSYTVAPSYHDQPGKSMFHKSTEPNSLIKLFLEERYPTSVNLISVIQQPVKTSSPFPHIFSSCVLENGLLKQPIERHDQRPYFAQSNNVSDESSALKRNSFVKHVSKGSDNTKIAVRVSSTPILTSVKSSTSLAPLFKRCSSQSALLKKWVSQHRHSDFSVEEESLIEADEMFRTLEQDYSVNTIHDSSDDSD